MILRRRSLRWVLALLVANIALGAAALAIAHDYAGVRETARDRLTRQLRNLSSERELSEEDRAYLQAHRAAYQDLVERGLLDPPDRLAVATLLDHLQQVHGLNAIRYSFSPQLVRPLGASPDSRLSLLSSSVSIEMFGTTDNDLLRFAEEVLATFPGDVRVTELRLSRRETVDAALLDRLRAGEPVDLVDGLLAFEWRSLQWRDRSDEQDAS